MRPNYLDFWIPDAAILHAHNDAGIIRRVAQEEVIATNQEILSTYLSALEAQGSIPSEETDFVEAYLVGKGVIPYSRRMAHLPAGTTLEDLTHVAEICETERDGISTVRYALGALFDAGIPFICFTQHMRRARPVGPILFLRPSEVDAYRTLLKDNIEQYCNERPSP